MDDNTVNAAGKISATREIVYTLLVYAALYIISFLLFILLINTPLFSGMKVLMYRGIVLLIITSIIASGLLLLLRNWRRISWLSVKDAVLVFILCTSINMVFFTLVPVTVERSVSVFMLSVMDSDPEKTYTEEEIGEIFVDKYVYEYEAFKKRFDEQVTTGSIEQTPDGSYKITSKGRFIVKLFRGISDLFDTDKRLVYPDQSEEQNAK